MMVGNGVTNFNLDTGPAQVDMYYWHSLVSTDWYQNYTANACSMAYFANVTAESMVCQELLEGYENVTADVNIYDILGTCY